MSRIKTTNPVVYKHPENGEIKTTGFLTKDFPNWKPLGLMVGNLVLPFEAGNISYTKAKEYYASIEDMPTAEELFGVWTSEVNEEFDRCVKFLGERPIDETNIPIREFPQGYSAQHGDRDAPFYRFAKTEEWRNHKPDTPNEHVGVGFRHSYAGMNAKPIYIRLVWRYKN